MSKILILDGNQRSALAVVRSLGELDLKIYVTDDSTSSLAGESKYATKYIQSPSVKYQPNEFLKWFIDFVSTEMIEIAFPVTEITSQFLLEHQHELPTNIKLPFAELKTIMQLANKCQLMQLAEQTGVPYPETRYFKGIDEIDISQENTFPIVLKPALSRIFIGDKWLDSSVHIIYSKQELERLLALEPDYLKFPFMLQEFIPGKGAGIFTIYQNGSERAFFAHKRLREKPPSGGVSVLSESVELAPQMLTAARKILNHVEWHGVAMVEFRVTESGEPYLMEVNTRFWGSLQLAIDSGVDFPKILYNMTVGNQVESVNNYNKGQQLRWLLGDLDRLYIVLKTKRRYSFLEKLKAILIFLCPKFYKRKMEVNRVSDFMPAIYEFKTYLRNLL